MPSLEDLTVDQLLAKAREDAQPASFLRLLTSNPETREQVQRLLKKVKPDLAIPEIDAADRVLQAVATEREERLKLERQIREDAIRQRVEKDRATVVDKYHLTEADMVKVQELMLDKDNPIPTFDAAARVYLASRTPATPTPAVFSPPTFTMPEKDKWGPGIGNPVRLNKIAVDEMFAAYNEILGGKVAGLGGARAN